MVKTIAYEKARTTRIKEGARLLRERIKEVKARERETKSQIRLEKTQYVVKEKEAKIQLSSEREREKARERESKRELSSERERSKISEGFFKTKMFAKEKESKAKSGIIGAQVKLEKAQLAAQRFEQQQKEKKSKSWKQLKKHLTKKITSRRVLKPSQMTMVIQKREQEPYKPIYMKEFIENEKRSMFFS